MNKKKLDPALKIVQVESLRERFKFIDDDLLQDNISIAFQYIIFLLSFEKEYEFSGVIKYSIFKDIVLQTASIVEAIISYKLQSLVKQKKIKIEDILEKEYEYKFLGKLYDISPTEIICGTIRTTIYPDIQNDTHFIKLNKVAKKCGLFDNIIFEKADKLRKLRNRIHLAGLEKRDDGYSEEEVIESFDIANGIITRIEKYNP